MTGRPLEGQRHIERALELAEQHPSDELLGWIHVYAVQVASDCGDAAAAMSHARALVAIVGRKSIPALEALAFGALGAVHLLQEEWTDAVAAHERALDLIREHRTVVGAESFLRVPLAEAHLGRGDIERARTVLDEVLALTRTRPAVEAAGQVVLARVLLRSEGARARSAIEAALAHAAALVAETGYRSLAPRIHEERAALARAVGDDAERQRQLREAHRLFTAMGATARAEAVARQLSSVSATG